jgi:hypothetical protein
MFSKQAKEVRDLPVYKKPMDPWSSLPCTVPGCTKRYRIWGPVKYCGSHNLIAKKNGDPLQRVPPDSVLEPLRERIIMLLSGSRIARSKREAIGDGMREILRELKAQCEDVEMQWGEIERRGKPHHSGLSELEYNRAKYRARAAVHILRVLNSKEGSDWKTVAAHVCALFFLQRYEPGRFVSQRAFVFMMAHHFRLITDHSDGVRWVTIRGVGRLERRYPKVNQRALELIGKTVIDTFSSLAARLIEYHEHALIVPDLAKHLFDRGLSTKPRKKWRRRRNYPIQP